jgi:hypothetical protein
MKPEFGDYREQSLRPPCEMSRKTPRGRILSSGCSLYANRKAVTETAYP